MRFSSISLSSFRRLGVFLVFLSAVESEAQFVAFNAQVAGPGTATNCTTWNIFGMPPGSAGPLKDIHSGLDLPARVSITTNGPVLPATGGANPPPGSLLFDLFHGYVDFAGGANPTALAQISGDGSVTYTFTGLNPQTIYRFQASVVGGGVDAVDLRKWSLCQIEGAASFISAHSAGAYTNGLAINQVAFNTGANTNYDFAGWDTIVPGDNGSFSVTCKQYAGPTPDGNTADGPYGYALSGFRLEETDAKVPRVVSVTSTGSTVTVLFSIPVQAAGATNALNYSLSNTFNPVAIRSFVLGTDNRTVRLSTDHQLPFMVHWLTVKGIVDAATGTYGIAPNSKVPYTNVGFTTGYVESDFFMGIPGTSISALTNSPNYPSRPTRVRYYPYSYWFDNTVGVNYGNRMFGILVPPTSGDYAFLIYSQGNSQLALSTNGDPTSLKVLVKASGGNVGVSDSVPLEAGQQYFIEALTKEGSAASDFVEFGWVTPDNPGNFALIPADYLGNYLTSANASLAITQQPSDAHVYYARSATFTVAATSNSKFTACTNYQWQVNGVDIPGATSASYTTPLLYQTDSGQSYRALVVIPGASQMSSEAVVTVTRDLVPPSVVQVLNFGKNTIQLLFSEPIAPDTAIDLANYSFSNGLSITAASLDVANLTVTLTTSPLVYGSNYNLTLKGITDQALTPNLIAGNTVVTFQPQSPVSKDIGESAVTSITTTAGNGIDVVAAGKDIGGTTDQLNFNFQLCSGDFDVQLRIAGLSASDLWAKAGLMAREDLSTNGRFAAALATPSMNGTFFEYRDQTNSVTSPTGSLPINYPNTWLRLQRLGDLFTGYASYDGRTWTELGSIYMTMSNLVYVGSALASHSTTQVASAQFRDLSTVGPDVVVGPVESGHESLGPSSRKTPIVISEIMYKPAPRTDGRNLEFLELYNSNPWFHDVSGYRIVAESMSFTLPAGTVLPGGGFLVVAASPESIQAIWGITNVVGPYTGSLKRAGTIQLIDEHDAVLLTIPYSNLPPWPVAADGTGHSLVLANPSYGEADPKAWDISDVMGGSPGAAEAFRPSPLRNIVINELLTHSENVVLSDFIELYNHSDKTVDLSGCWLTDDPALPRFRIPTGTVMAPGGFVVLDQAELGFGLKAAGETIYFINPEHTRVLDAIEFEPQADGVSFGRWPDGANAFYPLSARTPGTNNSPALINDIVINELMYDSISGNDDDQYIELYNKGTNTVSLANWQFTSGIAFAFPTNAQIKPDSYLVIARNLGQLLAKYPNLNSENALGNFTGKLSHNGERVALAMPQSINGSAAVYVVEDEVTYGVGGRWGQWSAGGGSSLELIDPRANHRLAANWADSDETRKSAWATIETTGTLDNGQNYGSGIDCVQIGLLDAGECLVDNIEVHAGTGGVNYVKNSTFETTSGLANWSLDGCMVRSSLENSGYASGHSLHIRCSSRIWTGANSCQGSLNSNPLRSSQTATIRFKARWLRGWPEVLMRLHGNWLETTGALPVPPNLGTPGAPNSRRIGNAGPAVFEVVHRPAVPPGFQPLVVTARVHDPDGIANLVLHYRIDPNLDYQDVPMTDDGLNGDAIADDGLFSAVIPGQYTGAVIAYYISASDNRGAASRFPALRDDNAPVPECVVMFGDQNPGGSFGVYHLWLTQTNLDRWSGLPNLSNEMHDGTFVNGNRVIYNMQGRFAGSPYHQQFYSPQYSVCHFKWTFPEDDKFLGATSFNKIHAPGNGPGDDLTLQREQTVNTFLRALGVPWLNRRYVALYVNGYRNVQLMEDTQCPDADMVNEYFPNDTNGWLFKMQPWFEFSSAASGNYVDFQNFSWCTIMPYLTTGRQKKTARYRYTFEVRRTPDSANNFTPVFSLIDAANSFSTPNYVANLENIADMENWMRVFAANHAGGNWDAFGSQNGQNLYGYIGTQGTKYSLMMFDFNIVLGNSGSWNPGENLFMVNSADPNESRIFSNPTFRRMYLRALQELVDGPLNLSQTGPLLDAKYAAFVANGVSAQSPAAIKSWVNSARNSISRQILFSTFSVDATVTITNNIAVVTGSAPVKIKTIWFNGIEWPVVWKSLTTWMATVPLKPGNNSFSVVGADIHGHPLTGATNILTVPYDGIAASPVGQVVINELMYHPAHPGSQFVELFNNSTNGFDISGWELPELAYTFPEGSLLGPGRYLVLTENRAAYTAAYGATNPVFDTFSQPLNAAGGSVSLLMPADDGNAKIVIAHVRYDSSPPWPAAADGAGGSLQLIDPGQDNWRVANWACSDPTLPVSPGASNMVQSSLAPFPALFLNELQADNLTGITNRAGQRTGWLELYNSGTNQLSLAGLLLANDYAQLTNWPFPLDAVINPGEFKIIFADGQTNLSTAQELHTSFLLTSGSGQLALSQLDTNGQARVLDYISYTNLAPNHAYGSIPDGQSFTRMELPLATPGNTNSGVTQFTVVINEWMAGNTSTLPDPVTGKYEDWFELYNYGPNAVDLAGCYLTHSQDNPFEFQIPPGYTLAPHSFLLVWADKQSTTATTDLHVNFKLSKSGTSIGLYDTNGVAIDFVTFGTQTSDISMGRYPDGASTISVLPRATPHAGNSAPNAAPELVPPADTFVYLGQTLHLTLHGSDPDVPAQILSYSLEAGAPANATLDPTTGQFAWTPSANQTPSTNWFAVHVTDNGTPPLTTRQFFIVTVGLPPQLSLANLSDDQVTFGWHTLSGQLYQIEFKQELSDASWTPLGGPVTGNGSTIAFSDSLASLGNRYFRLRLLP